MSWSPGEVDEFEVYHQSVLLQMLGRKRHQHTHLSGIFVRCERAGIVQGLSKIDELGWKKAVLQKRR